MIPLPHILYEPRGLLWNYLPLQLARSHGAHILHMRNPDGGFSPQCSRGVLFEDCLHFRSWKETRFAVLIAIAVAAGVVVLKRPEVHFHRQEASC